MTKPLAGRIAALLALLAATPLLAIDVDRPAVDEISPIPVAGETAVPAIDPLQLPPAIEAMPAQTIPGVTPELESNISAALAAPADLAQPPVLPGIAGQAEAAPAAPIVSPADAAGAAIGANPTAAPAVNNANATANFHRDITQVQAALSDDPTAGAGTDGLGKVEQLFTGRKHQGNGVVAVPSPRGQSAQFTVNDEGVQIYGRAAADYAEVKAIQAAYGDKIDMSESIKGMDDAYSDAYAKLSILQAVAQQRKTSDNATRLQSTLQRVDGIINDHGKKIAVTTHQVFFHEAADSPESEIAEGIRRVDGYLASAVRYFQPGGKADRQFGRLDEVVMGFDTRGYPQIKAHLQEKLKEIQKTSRRPIRFVYLDDVAPIPQGKQQMRDALNGLIKRYKDNPGLSELMGGVIHSRYTGMLLELKTLVHYYQAGYQILQSGRVFFDEKGHYVTELDAVVRSPEGKVILVEAKSTRDSLPPQMVLEDKVKYKLRTYQARRAEIEKQIGYPIDEVVFSFDVGQNAGLKPFLEEQRAALSQRYGFPVSFLFIDSVPQPAGR